MEIVGYSDLAPSLRKSGLLCGSDLPLRCYTAFTPVLIRPVCQIVDLALLFCRQPWDGLRSSSITSFKVLTALKLTPSLLHPKVLSKVLMMNHQSAPSIMLVLSTRQSTKFQCLTKLSQWRVLVELLTVHLNLFRLILSIWWVWIFTSNRISIRCFLLGSKILVVVTSYRRRPPKTFQTIQNLAAPSAPLWAPPPSVCVVQVEEKDHHHLSR